MLKSREQRDARLVKKYFMDNESYAKAVCLKLLRAERARIRRVIKKLADTKGEVSAYPVIYRLACDHILAALKGTP